MIVEWVRRVECTLKHAAHIWLSDTKMLPTYCYDWGDSPRCQTFFPSRVFTPLWFTLFKINNHIILLGLCRLKAALWGHMPDKNSGFSNWGLSDVTDTLVSATEGSQTLQKRWFQQLGALRRYRKFSFSNLEFLDLTKTGFSYLGQSDAAKTWVSST